MPWVRVFTEGVVIILSILIAFWIDAAWDTRQDRFDEFQILKSLDAEFAGQVADLERRTAVYDELADAGRWLLNEASSADPVEEIDRALLAVLYAGTYDPGRNARDALISSGRLELLQNQALRTMVAGWQAVVDETRDNELGMREFVFRELVPYLASIGVEAGRAVLDPEDGVRLLSPDLAAPAYARMLGDPAFRSLAQFRINWLLGSQREFREAAAEARRLHEAVRSELGARWRR